MKKIAFTALAVAAMMVTISSHADQSRAERAKELKNKLTERFNAADLDHDGKLTLAEAQSGMPRVAKSFDAIDTQKNGYVTLKQVEAYTVKLLRKRRGRKQNSDDE
jgi:Ca2+-binding EF-hand superfamily protein